MGSSSSCSDIDWAISLDHIYLSFELRISIANLSILQNNLPAEPDSTIYKNKFSTSLMASSRRRRTKTNEHLQINFLRSIKSQARKSIRFRRRCRSRKYSCYQRNCSSQVRLCSRAAAVNLNYVFRHVHKLVD